MIGVFEDSLEPSEVENLVFAAQYKGRRPRSVLRSLESKALSVLAVIAGCSWASKQFLKIWPCVLPISLVFRLRM